MPVDWTLAPIADLGGNSRPVIKAGPFGSAIKKENYVNSGYKIYGQEQVIRGDHLFGDYYIDRRKFQQLESCSVKPGDILLSLVGTTGRVLLVPEGAPPGIINPRLLRLSFDSSRVLSLFFKYVAESDYFQLRLERSAQGGTMGVLNAGAVKPIQVMIPPLPEQRAIAAALSDADALIASLDALIAKKRDLKQAAMQQLLTGKTRLPGFEANGSRPRWSAYQLS
jgi:type I restriction enzyme S subunit